MQQRFERPPAHRSAAILVMAALLAPPIGSAASTARAEDVVTKPDTPAQTQQRPIVNGRDIQPTENELGSHPDLDAAQAREVDELARQLLSVPEPPASQPKGPRKPKT